MNYNRHENVQRSRLWHRLLHDKLPMKHALSYYSSEMALLLWGIGQMQVPCARVSSWNSNTNLLQGVMLVRQILARGYESFWHELESTISVCCFSPVDWFPPFPHEVAMPFG